MNKQGLINILMAFILLFVAISIFFIIDRIFFTIQITASMEDISYQYKGFPINKDKTYEVIQEQIRTITAYNVGDVAQTDSSPCIDASGGNICEALERGEKRCAFNYVPLGTYIDVADLGKYLVTDRTSKKYSGRVDIAFPLDQKQEALEFGIQNRLVKILK